MERLENELWKFLKATFWVALLVILSVSVFYPELLFSVIDLLAKNYMQMLLIAFACYLLYLVRWTWALWYTFDGISFVGKCKDIVLFANKISKIVIGKVQGLTLLVAFTFLASSFLTIPFSMLFGWEILTCLSFLVPTTFVAILLNFSLYYKQKVLNAAIQKEEKSN